MYMTKIFRLLYGRLRIQERLIEPTISLKWINRKIAHSERSQVLEEMGTLTRVYPIILQSAFHDHPCVTDMRPFHRNTQPRVAAPPDRPGPTNTYPFS